MSRIAALIVFGTMIAGVSQADRKGILERANELNKELNAKIGKVGEASLPMLSENLDELESILRYGAKNIPLMCSKTVYNTWEVRRVEKDKAKGIGYPFKLKQECFTAVRSRARAVVCTGSVYGGARVIRIRDNSEIGTFKQSAECFQSTASARRGYVCTQNVYKDYELVRINDKKKFGSYDLLSDCIESIPY